jgi:hypothetical protein
MQLLSWKLAIHTVSQPGPYRNSLQRHTPAGGHTKDTIEAIGPRLLMTISAMLKSGRSTFPPTDRPASGRSHVSS